MPVIQKKVSLAAGISEDNALSGSAFEFLQRNSVISAGVLSDTAGCFVTIQSGSDIILEESEAAVGTGYPRVPDEMFYNDVGAAGDRLVIRLRNPTAGAIEFSIIVQVTAL
jgi:hypothetical protein